MDKLGITRYQAGKRIEVLEQKGILQKVHEKSNGQTSIYTNSKLLKILSDYEEK